LPSLTDYGNEGTDNGTLRWWLRLTHFLGITMVNEQKPNSWQFNPATVTLALVLFGLVAGGSYWVGQRDANDRHLLERLDRMEKTAQQAKDLSLSAAGSAGHKEAETKPEKK
jgi:hypothetical protein